MNAKQKLPEAVKKGVVKQSGIKSIVWHLRWLVRTRADISLQPSGFGKTKNWYQVAAKCIGKNKGWYQVAPNWIGKVIQGLIQEQIYMQIFLNCHLVTF